MTEHVSSAGILFVVSAPSGAGKTSLLNEVFKKFDDISFSVSVTTRAPRNGEVDGVNYRFVSDVTFDRCIEEGAFAEWAEVHSKRYGTLVSTINESLENGGVLVLDTDTVGAFNIRKSFPEAVLVFIAPPSPEALEDRLRKRNTESQEMIEKRLNAAPGEIRCMPDYNYIVINDDFDHAVDCLTALITAEKLKSDRILPQLTSWRSAIDGL